MVYEARWNWLLIHFLIGANHAIIDASNLAAEISHAFNNTKTLDEAISSYYDEMIPRGENAVTQSHIASEKVHSTREQVIEMYKSMRGATVGKLSFQILKIDSFN